MLSSTAIAALVAGALALGFSGNFPGFGHDSEVRVNLGQLTWWSSSPVALTRMDAVPLLSVTQPRLPEVGAEAIAEAKAVAQAKASTWLKRKQIALSAAIARRKARALAEAVLKAQLAEAPVTESLGAATGAPTLSQLQTQSDQVTVARSAPQATESAPAAGASDADVSEKDRQSLRDAHQLLKARFLLAMSSQKDTAPVVLAAAEEVTTQTADKKPAAVEVAPLGKLKRPARAKKRSNAHRISEKSAAVEKAVLAEVQPAKAVENAENQGISSSSPIKTEVAVAALPTPAPALFASTARQLQKFQGPVDQVQATQARELASLDENQQAEGSPSEGDTDEATFPVVSTLAANTVTSAIPVATQAEQKARDYSTGTPVATQSDAVEAFDWSTPIAQTISRTISHEGSATGNQARWIRWISEKHWSTLYWSSNQNSSPKVPLISNNTALLLATLLSGTALQPDAGIVFGRVSKGWTVEFSGRAEKPLFFDSNRAQVNATDTDQDRYFAFINAAPGSHLLYLVRRNSSDRAAVALPVTEGSATYMDMTRTGQRDVTGRVLDASSPHAAPLKAVNVRVVGQPGKLALTDSAGTFRISHVLTVQDYPLYLETLDREGFTHRYRLSGPSGDSLTLFRFPQKAVMNWLHQLEGGISAESGLVVGAVPMLAANHDKGTLFAQVRPMLGSTTLKPETYTLSPDDRLVENAPLDTAPPRFVSLQIPEGANIAQIESRTQQPVWSELIFASPGVINVVGPY